MGLNKKIITDDFDKEIYEEKFGEKYICTINADSLNRAKEIYKEILVSID